MTTSLLFLLKHMLRGIQFLCREDTLVVLGGKELRPSANSHVTEPCAWK